MPLLHILIELVYMSWALCFTYPLVRQPLRPAPKDNSTPSPLHVLEHPGKLKLRAINTRCQWDYAVCGVHVCRASGGDCTDVHGIVAIYIPATEHRRHQVIFLEEVVVRGFDDDQAEERVRVRVRGRGTVQLRGVEVRGVMRFEIRG